MAVELGNKKEAILLKVIFVRLVKRRFYRYALFDHERRVVVCQEIVWAGFGL